LTDEDDPAAAVDRLERALERIAALAARGHQVITPVPALVADADVHELAERLDVLIAHLREVLRTTADP
jgi:hypothetical protein